MMNTKIILNFGTNTDDTFNLTIPYASSGKSQLEIGECMDSLITLKTFTSTRGELNKRISTQMVTTETTVL